MNDIFNILSIAAKAGAVSLGSDPVKEAIAGKKAGLIILASDISAKSEKEMRFFSDKENLPVYKTGFSKDDFRLRLGKSAAVIAVGKSFVKAFEKHY